MCGIVGAYCFLGHSDRFTNVIQDSLESLKQRGPDHQNFWNNEKIVLGHTRLSVIDTSVQAHQPMHDETNRYTIIYNGEVYNTQELLSKHAIKTDQFKSHSDTEAILALFKVKGVSIFNELNGFFGIAIYDKENNSLVIARDKFGIKPLYFYADNEQLLFASELKALIPLGIPLDIDKVALNLYLHLNYVPAPLTMLQGSKKLEPGQYLEIKDNNFSIHNFFDLKDIYEQPHTKLSYEQACQELYHKMESAVQKRLISDVPLGTFLSGGIDSSITTAIASQHVPKLSTFSIGFADHPYFDETEYAMEVANKFKTNHHVFKLTEEDQYQELFNVLDYFDEPFADSSALPVYILSKKVKNEITVALSGDGADEIFAGYNKYHGEYLQRNKGLKENIVSGLHPLWSILPNSRNSKMGNTIRKLNKFSSGAKHTPADRYWQWCGYTNNENLHLLHPSFIGNENLLRKESEMIQNSYCSSITKMNGINDWLYTDCNLVLQNDMLTKVDRMSMAASLEVRVPFLDHDIVNFAFSLPSDYKINGQLKKRVLQDSFRSLLPEKLYNRPKKGFEVPLLDWLKGGLTSLRNELFAPDFIEEQGIFQLNEIQKLNRQLLSNNPGDSHARIWGLIVFQYWYKKVIMGEKIKREA